MSSWPRVPLGDLVIEERPQRSASDEPVWILNLDQIEPDTGRVLKRVRVSQDVLGPSTYPFAAGTVLYSKLRPYLNKVVVADEPGIATTELVPLRCEPQKAVPSYIAYFLRSAEFLSFANTVVAGAKMPRMVMSEFWKYQVPLPPLNEQRRIAAILDKADALRTKRREALAQLGLLAQSIFIEMFGDPVTNPKGWPKARIADLGSVVTGNTPSRANAGNYGHATEWIKSDNINTPHYYLTRASEGLSEAGKRVGRTAPPNSVLVTCIAGSPDCIGNSAMTDREVAFNQQINAFIPRIGNPHFHYAQFVVGKRLIQRASTDGMKGMVSKGKFEQIEVPLPPAQLQEAFAERALTIVAMTEGYMQAVDDLDALFASLQHRAFHGAL